MIPGLSTIKLIGLGVAALFLLLLVADRARFMHRAHVAEAQVAEVCAAIRQAANRPKLDCKQMPQQIQFLGDALNAVRTKTAAAKAEDAAHAREVESRQNIASQESSNDYQTELSRVRAEYDRLRNAAARRTDQGGRGSSSVSGAAASASGPDAAAAQAGLPPEDALTATEQAIQLKAIQDWARKVGLAPAH